MLVEQTMRKLEKKLFLKVDVNFLYGKRKNVFSLAEIDILRKQIIAKARKYNILGKTFLQIGKSFFISKVMQFV